MPFHQQGQDRSFERLVRLQWLLLGGQGAFQCCLPFPFPGVERLARDVMAPTHLTHDSVASLLGQQFAHPLDSLARCARMGMKHWFLPAGGTVRFSLPYLLREVFGNSFLSHCQVLSSFFEPCLRIWNAYAKEELLAIKLNCSPFAVNHPVDKFVSASGDNDLAV